MQAAPAKFESFLYRVGNGSLIEYTNGVELGQGVTTQGVLQEGVMVSPHGVQRARGHHGA